MSVSPLPISWTMATVEQVAEVNGRSFSPLPQAIGLPVHFVPMSAVVEEFGGIDVSSRRPLGEAQKGYTAFVEGDVLFAKITPCMENGKIALVPPLPDHIAYGSTEFQVLRANGVVAPKWLAHFVAQREFRRLARRNMTGSAGQMRVPTSWLAAAPIPVAPLREQHRIVEKLEELLSDLEAGVAELRVAQAKLRVYRQSLLKAAVTGELTAEWRVKFSGLTRSPNEHETSTDSELPRLPPSWRWSSVGQIGAIQGGIQKQPSRTPVLNRYPFLRVANVARDELRLDDVHEIELFEGELKRVGLLPGDVLIVEGNGSRTEIGRCAVWSGEIANTVHQNHLIRVRPTGVRSRFLAAWLNSPMGIGRLAALAATTSGLYTLSVSKIARIPVPVPPLDEQDQIVELLEEGKAILHEQAISISHALRQSEAQRKNILKAAFSGQLVPQDPNDEPASVLLERIRTSRAQKATAPTRRTRKVKEPA